MTNSNKYILDLIDKLPNKNTLNILLDMNLLLILSIGPKKEQLLLLKIKDNAVHVGLSAQLDLSKVLTKSKIIIYYHSLNKN